MSSIIMSMLAETFIHPGCGQTDGAVDLPVAREKITSYPYITGSSLKGAWRDYAQQNDIAKAAISQMFGGSDSAGQILFSDARILLLPVRSMEKSYCWVTCPLILERLQRDFKRTSTKELQELNLTIDENSYVSAFETTSTLFLEERCFNKSSDEDNKIEPVLKLVKQMIPFETIKNRLEDQLVVISDTNFKWFSENALCIQARNKLDEHKQSENLWYEETLPPDTLMFSIVSQRSQENDSLDILTKKIKNRPYLQVGGNETVGQGWFMVEPVTGNT